MKLDKHNLKRIIDVALHTQEEEIGCTECFEHMDRYAEMLRAGKDPAQVLPLVDDHLQRCQNCREEFEILLTVLDAPPEAQDV